MAAGTTGRPSRGRAGWNTPMLPGRGPLARVPAVGAFAGVIVVFAVAVIVGGVVGTVLIGALVVGVLALLAATWTRLAPAERIGRVLVLVVLLAVMYSIVTGAGR